MRVVLIFLIFSFLNADITQIVNEIKAIENYRFKCKKDINYNLFKNTKSISRNFVIYHKKDIIYAIFGDKVNINHRWFKVGDYVNGYKIVRISNNGVFLKKENKLMFLKLSNKNILKVKK